MSKRIQAGQDAIQFASLISNSFISSVSKYGTRARICYRLSYHMLRNRSVSLPGHRRIGGTSPRERPVAQETDDGFGFLKWTGFPSGLETIPSWGWLNELRQHGAPESKIIDRASADIIIRCLILATFLLDDHDRLDAQSSNTYVSAVIEAETASGNKQCLHICQFVTVALTERYCTSSRAPCFLRSQYWRGWLTTT